jgi:polyisoprenoid-binding protein YceI
MKHYGQHVLIALVLIFSSFGYIISCTHENMPPPPSSGTPVIERGTDVLLPGSMTAGDTTQWKFDQAHSSVLWSTNYVGAAGLLTGRFNDFGMHDVTDDKMKQYQTTGQPLLDSSWAFYENEPAKTYFNGYVQVNTTNTGEPNRDTGCAISSLGTVKIIPGVQNLEVNNLAKIKTTNVAFDTQTSGYIITMDMTWQGLLAQPLTKSITGTLSYVRKNYVSPGTPSQYGVFGLQLTFQFNCRDFGITSTNISDNITIQCNMNFNNK